MNKLFICVLLCFYGQNVVSGDISDAKRIALEKIISLMNDHKRLVNETLTALPNKEAYLNVIAKHIEDTGDDLLKSTYFSIHKTAVSGQMMALLLKSSEDVTTCVEYKEKEGHDEAKRYYNQMFQTPVKQYKDEAELIQSNDIKAWINDYNAAAAQFTEIHDRTVEDIQKSNDEEEIQRIVYDFSRNHREMEKIVVKVDSYMERLQIQFLQVLGNLVVDIRNTMRIKEDKAVVAVRDCFAGTLLEEMMTNMFFTSKSAVHLANN